MVQIFFMNLALIKKKEKEHIIADFPNYKKINFVEASNSSSSDDNGQQQGELSYASPCPHIKKHLTYGYNKHANQRLWSDWRWSGSSVGPYVYR